MSTYLERFLVATGFFVFSIHICCNCVPDQEIQFLVDLLTNTNTNDTWEHPYNTTWSLQSIQNNPCNLTGIICDYYPNDNQSYIISITINDGGLDGEIPNSIVNLTHLQYINIANNYLYSLPVTICDLSSLIVLHAPSNNFHGTFMLCIFQIQSLEYLNIAWNNLTNFTNIKKVTTSKKPFSLKYLYLNNNQFDSTIPSLLYYQYNLTEIHIENNHFKGNIDDNIYQLKLLKYFSAQNNKLFGTIPRPSDNEINASLPNLEYLNLANQYHLYGLVPDDISVLWPNLIYLDLHSNHLSGTISSSFRYLSNMETLLLNHNSFTGTLPIHMFDTWSSLKYLMLQSNFFQGKFPSFNHPNSLIVLDISSNSFQDSLHLNFSSKCSLTALFLNDNSFEGEIPYLLVNCFNLTEIALHNNEFTGTLPSFVLYSDTNITTLTLHSNRLTDKNLERWLQDLFLYNPYLQYLSIHNNRGISGKLPSNTKAPYLTTLYAHSNDIYGSIPDSFITFQDSPSVLANVTLFDNRLSCQLPPNLINPNVTSTNSMNGMFLLGNRFETDDGSDKLPNYVNDNFQKATNLYLSNIDTSLEYGILGFAFCFCFIIIIIYRLRLLPSILSRYCTDCCEKCNLRKTQDNNLKPDNKKPSQRLLLKSATNTPKKPKAKSSVFAFAFADVDDLSYKVDIEQFILPDEYELTLSTNQYENGFPPPPPDPNKIKSRNTMEIQLQTAQELHLDRKSRSRDARNSVSMEDGMYSIFCYNNTEIIYLFE